ncbi:MAG TPA: type II toxin-antitoxin system RelE/ParE family toxin [Pseudonocardiaceae bacterium]|nr:type II toxin-antitoxin system RelE/ParE family toxin [Pseudonocardiaceae bacterium]
MIQPYRVELTTAAERQLRKLDKPIQKRPAIALAKLAADPRPAGVKALTGVPAALRIRVGDYRIVYLVQDQQLIVLVLGLGHRRQVYRDFS